MNLRVIIELVVMATKVIIVGAGPAGVLLAHYLLRRGNYEISIYERRSDPRFASFANDRTFPLGLSQRGLKALRQIEGLEDRILSQGTLTKGTLRHQKNGKVSLIPRKKALLMIDRLRLVITLLQDLIEKDKNSSIKLYFDCQCTQINLKEKTLEFTQAKGEVLQDNYDLLIGADGANSAVRKAFINSEQQPLDCQLTYTTDVYKSIFLTRINDKTGLKLDSDKIHTWRTEDLQIILAPQDEKALNGVIIFNPENNFLEKLITKEDVLNFFAEQFPEMDKIMSEEEAEALLKRPISQVLTVLCNRYHQGDSVLILGDAAHAVSPALGQGCNSALEDVEIFNNILDEMRDDWTQAVPEFTQRRLKDAHALRELSDYTFPRTKPLFFEFFIRLTLARVLHKILPNIFQPFCVDLLFESTVPYSKILQSSQGWITKVKKLYQ